MFPEPAHAVMVEQLRLRHRLVPYLHAMNRRAHREGRSLVEPTYFEDTSLEAYMYRDQYLFGSELLVAPIVRPVDRTTRLAVAEAWLPAGRWTDVTTGISYRGGRLASLHRDVSSIPVLLRAGGFLPLVAEGESLDIRETTPALEVLVAGGADGTFTLAEETEPGTWAETVFSLDIEAGRLTIEPATGDGAPARTTWELTLLGFGPEAADDLTARGAEIQSVTTSDGRVRVRLVGAGTEPVVLVGAGLGTTGPGDVLGQVEKVLRGAAIGYFTKDLLFAQLERDGAAALSSLAAYGTVPVFTPEDVEHGHPTPELVAALTELLLADR